MMSEHASCEQELPTALEDIDRIGAILVAARENLNMKAEDVANCLRLSLRQIQALEHDDFAVLPEPVITRGFIRNYARLVDIDAVPLLHVYNQYVPEQYGQAISIRSSNIVISNEAGTSRRLYVWIGGALVILLSGWVLYVDFFQKHNIDDGLPEAVMPRPSVVPKPAAQTRTPAAGALASVIQPDSASQAALDNDVQLQSTMGGAYLKFSVDEATWISISDSRGRQIVNKILAANSEEVITASLPLSVVIGNINGTKFEYNNIPVDLSSYAKLNVARLTLE